MEETLRIEQTIDGKKSVIKLSGQIDENAGYSCVKLDGIDEISFDFEKVNLINSTGLQKWISFVEKISPRIAIKFEKCPLRIVNQINLFPGFLANRKVEIESFFAPYYCVHCDSSKNVLLVTKSHFSNKLNPVAPEISCPSCNKRMEFDGIEKKYFLFLKRNA